MKARVKEMEAEAAKVRQQKRPSSSSSSKAFFSLPFLYSYEGATLA
jgi:hypothetical protein